MKIDPIKDMAWRLCREDGWDDPEIVLAINDGPPGQPVDDCARPIWHRYIEAARQRLISE